MHPFRFIVTTLLATSLLMAPTLAKADSTAVVPIYLDYLHSAMVSGDAKALKFSGKGLTINFNKPGLSYSLPAASRKANATVYTNDGLYLFNDTIALYQEYPNGTDIQAINLLEGSKIITLPSTSKYLVVAFRSSSLVITPDLHIILSLPAHIQLYESSTTKAQVIVAFDPDKERSYLYSMEGKLLRSFPNAILTPHCIDSGWLLVIPFTATTSEDTFVSFDGTTVFTKSEVPPACP